MLYCNDDDVLTGKEFKYKKNLKGRKALPLCVKCVKLKVQPPRKLGTATNFIQKRRQAKTAKNKKRANALANGVGKTRKSASKKQKKK